MSILFHPHQQYVFLGMLVFGIAAGIFYDLLSVKRLFLGSSFLACFIDDVLFSFGAWVIFIVSTFLLNSGVVRWYGIASYLFGFMMYKATVSRLVIIAFKGITSVLKRIMFSVIKILQIIVSPIIAFFRFAVRVVFKLMHPLIAEIHEKVMLRIIFNSFNDLYRTGKW